MSPYRLERMLHLFRCVICGRLCEVVLLHHESPVLPLEAMGARVSRPDTKGFQEVQGCADCQRYTLPHTAHAWNQEGQ